MREARRLSQVSTSMIRRMFEIVEKARKEGREIISLTIGEPDFDTPAEVVERACRAMKAGYTHYTSNFGLEELREAIAERYGVDAAQVMITTGGSEALINASLAFIEEGSKVVIPTPNFLSYFTYARLCGGKIVQLRTHDNGFLPDINQLNEVVDRNVSVIFLNYPNNPTGVVIGERELKAIVEIARDNGAVVVSDEIYDQIYYDVKPTSLAGEENVVCVNGFSKSLSMTGWRIGFTIADESLIDPILKVHQVNGVCAPAFAQKAVADIFAEGLFDSIVSRMVDEFRRRRDYLYSELIRMYDVVKPEGAFYMFVNVGENCMRYAEKLIELGVAVTPGIPFGDYNETYVRISYANSLENLQKAVGIIRDYESQRA